MTKFYMTTGTRDFLKKAQEKNDELILSHGSGHSVLMHETNGPSVFQTPRSYEVIASVGELEKIGYFVLNNIPVTDEGRPIFEYRFKNNTSKLQDHVGFIAFRLLRPINSDTYIVLTEWSDPKYYDLWKNSRDFAESHKEDKQTRGTSIYASKSYVTTYRTRPIDEEEHAEATVEEE